MAEDDQEKLTKPALERDRPPGELRSWEMREEASAASEKRWARLAKTFLYTVWITLLLIAIVAIILYKLYPPR